MLGTLADLKGKMDIPASDTSRDDALTLALETASAKVLDMTRYSEADVTGHQQIFRNVQYNRDLFLDLRPVKTSVNAVVFEGRPFGQGAGGITPAWSSLDGDIIDAQEGRFMVVGAQGWWPPHNTLEPRFQRWRDPIWPIIRVTYDVSGLGPDPASELIDAAAGLAAFWFDRDLAAASDASQFGQLRREWLNEAMPVSLRSKLDKHLRGKGTASWV